MYNPDVAYRGPDPATRALANEFITVHGAPARPSEFVTGYKAWDNVSGHNPDSNGVTHGVDIFAGPGNVPFQAMRESADKLCYQARNGYDNRAMYYIYADQIASPKTGWQFEGSGWKHPDHLHVSTWDGYWGGYCSLPSSIYDDDSSWGIADINDPGLEFDMAKPEDVAQLVQALMTYETDKSDGTGKISLERFLQYSDGNNKWIINKISEVLGKVSDINVSGGKTVTMRQAMAYAWRNAEAAALNTAPIIHSGGRLVTFRQKLADVFNAVKGQDPVLLEIAEAVKVPDVGEPVISLDKVD